MRTPPRTRNREAVITRTAVAGRKREKTHNTFEVEHRDHGAPFDDMGEVSHVGVSSSMTLNLGDGNFIKVQVSLDAPCAPTKKARAKLYDELSEEAASLLEIEYHNTKTTKDELNENSRQQQRTKKR